MIYCRGCGNELYWEEDTQEDGTTIYYTCLCSECNRQYLNLRNAVSMNIKKIGKACVALSAVVLAGDTKHRETASHSLHALRNIEQALDECGGME